MKELIIEELNREVKMKGWQFYMMLILFGILAHIVFRVLQYI